MPNHEKESKRGEAFLGTRSSSPCLIIINGLHFFLSPPSGMDHFQVAGNVIMKARLSAKLFM